MAALDERPRYMPPEPMPRGGPAGAGRDGARGGRGEGPRPVCRLEDPPASRLGEQRQDRRSPGRVVDVLIRQGTNASGLVPCVRLGRTPARNGPVVSPGRMALTGEHQWLIFAGYLLLRLSLARFSSTAEAVRQW